MSELVREEIISKCVEKILVQLGEDEPFREGVKETPQRFARALLELTAGMRLDEEEELRKLKKMFEVNKYDGMVVCRGIEFYSLCEHHLLPFFGEITIGYVPGERRVLGLSKIPRLTEIYTRRIQTQEVMTDQIADAFMRIANPLGVGVYVRAKHLCMMARGVKKDAEMTTMSLRGIFYQEKVKNEFLSYL